MRHFQEAGACDCHSHVFGPFARFPLSSTRTFDPPESPISALNSVWESFGIERAVLVQGSAHGDDPAALLEAILLSPSTRRGVMLVDAGVTDQRIAFLHEHGIRAIRFNWIRHLLGSDTRTHAQRLAEAATLARKVARFNWHIEVHIDMEDLDLAEAIAAPIGMPIVIDHMARIDMTSSSAGAQIAKLLRLLEKERFWVKISGADRLAAEDKELPIALKAMRAVLGNAPDRCVWGLDWPHVNLNTRRSDVELVELVQEAAGDQRSLVNVLVANPARLYGFDAAAA